MFAARKAARNRPAQKLTTLQAARFRPAQKLTPRANPIVIIGDRKNVKKEEGVLVGDEMEGVHAGDEMEVDRDDYDFTRIQRSVKRPVEELQELFKDTTHRLTNRREVLTLQVVRALLNWIPTVHNIALQADDDDDSEIAESTSSKAHECLLFAAATLMTVDKLQVDSLEDLSYGRQVQLRSEDNVVIQSWPNVSGYDPFRILLWVWRDICLSLLTKEDSSKVNSSKANSSTEKAGVVVSRILNDIRNCVPLDSYDVREKVAKRSLWDLFLNGGFESKRVPTYWSLCFTRSKKQLDQLYISCRLNELQEHPSYDLYAAIKEILPDRYKSQALTVVQNISHSMHTLNGRIDIFIYERCTKSLDKLIHDGLFKRDTAKFRKYILALSRDRKAAQWAYDQVVKGFDEATSRFYGDLLKVFPDLNQAILLERGKEMHIMEEFLANARGNMVMKDYHTGTEEKWVYIFRGYHNLALEWCEPLRKQIKEIFENKLGFLLMYGRFVGEVLRRGCKRYDEENLNKCIEYLICDDMGFEEILGGAKERAIEPIAKKARVKRNNPLFLSDDSDQDLD